jgi:hypothetical protein
MVRTGVTGDLRGPPFDSRVTPLAHGRPDGYFLVISNGIAGSVASGRRRRAAAG